MLPAGSLHLGGNMTRGRAIGSPLPRRLPHLERHNSRHKTGRGGGTLSIQAEIPPQSKPLGPSRTPRKHRASLPRKARGQSPGTSREPPGRSTRTYTAAPAPSPGRSTRTRQRSRYLKDPYTESRQTLQVSFSAYVSILSKPIFVTKYLWESWTSVKKEGKALAGIHTKRSVVQI